MNEFFDGYGIVNNRGKSSKYWGVCDYPTGQTPYMISVVLSTTPKTISIIPESNFGERVCAAAAAHLYGYRYTNFVPDKVNFMFGKRSFQIDLVDRVLRETKEKSLHVAQLPVELNQKKIKSPKITVTFGNIDKIVRDYSGKKVQKVQKTGLQPSAVEVIFQSMVDNGVETLSPGEKVDLINKITSL